MDIEIRELLVRLNLSEKNDGTAGTAHNLGKSGPFDNPQDRELLVDACVQRVLEILEDRKERH